MDNKKLGTDPAFPIVPVYNPQTGMMDYDYMFDNRMGMSRRLYIATKITQGILSNDRLRNAILMDSKTSLNKNPRLSSDGYLVKHSYRITDELLKQENKEDE